jgi:hypothetical protein|tara:strand:+ start:837 stop:1442 length:606 start_codon:yes stop_codon:yes gene_type:complete
MIKILEKKLSIEEVDFWKKHPDREFIGNNLFPKIGKYFKNKKHKKILDIGIQSINRADKDLLQNDNIEFYGLDKVKDCEIPEDWAKVFYVDLTEKKCFDKKLNKYFDAIIDYGVLGVWWSEFGMGGYDIKEDNLRNYIDNILYILKDNGLYFFKIDLWGECEKMKYLIYEYFDLTEFYDISSVKIGNEYETYVLKKKLKII